MFLQPSVLFATIPDVKIEIGSIKCRGVLSKSNNINKNDIYYLITVAHCSLDLLSKSLKVENVFITDSNNRMYMRKIYGKPIFTSAEFLEKAVPLLQKPTTQNKIEFFKSFYKEDLVIVPLKKELITNYFFPNIVFDPLDVDTVSPDDFFSGLSSNNDLSNSHFIFKNNIYNFSSFKNDELSFEWNFTDDKINIIKGDSGRPLLINIGKKSYITGFASGFTTDQNNTTKTNKFSSWNQMLQDELSK